MKLIFSNKSIAFALICTLLWPNTLQSQQLPCHQVLLGMVGVPLEVIDNSGVSKGSLSEFKDCPYVPPQCSQSCFKWTPDRADEASFCFGATQSFLQNESVILTDQPSFRYRLQHPSQPNEISDFFWTDSNQTLAKEKYGSTRNKYSTEYLWGVMNIAQSQYTTLGFIDCDSLFETADVPTDLNSKRQN